MAKLHKDLEKDLDELINLGLRLQNAMFQDCYPEDFDKQLEAMFAEDKKAKEDFLKRVPDFETDYQEWYSKAQAVIKQILPDRLADFNSHYEYPRPRKEISFENYMIRDYLQGLRVTRGGGLKVLVDGSAALPEFKQQLSLLNAAKKSLTSKLLDLTNVLQADLFDSEVQSAEALSKAGFLRAAGVICGVIIEKHLRKTCDFYDIKVRKKNPSISDLSQLLKDEDKISVPQWRFNQHLADIRNICAHSKGREPKKEELEDLISGTSKVLKSVF